MKNEAFKKYKRIKNQIKYNYNGYPVEKILAIDLGILIFNQKNFTLKSYVSYILKHTLPIYFRSLNLNTLKVDAPSKTLFSIGTFKRRDYYEIREDVRSRIGRSDSIDFSTQQVKYVFVWRNIYLAWSIINKAKELKLFTKFRLAAKIAHYLNVINELEKTNPVYGKYCAFSSVHDYETILTAFFQKKKIETYSLQHGIYSVQWNKITLDMILYENFISDFHLCWGQYTKDEFVKFGINKDKLIVAGYPRKKVKPAIPSSLNKNECLLMLTSYMYHEANAELLDIINQLKSSEYPKLNVKVKLHPNSDRQKYKEMISEYNWEIVPQEETLTALFGNNEFGWAVSINSAAYYEAYMYNIPCLRYNNSTFEDSVDINNDKFDSLDGLKECIQEIPFQESQQLKAYFQKTYDRLDYAIGINTDEYQVLKVDSEK